MYICICNGITENDIRRAVREGTHDLPTLTMQTGCAGTCGSCACAAQSVIDESLAVFRPGVPSRIAA